MPKSNTLIKICGLTSEEQALQVAKLGAHAIGIISVEQSPRYISAEIKKNIFTTLERLYPKIERVSVVQNCPIDSIIQNFLGKPSETKIFSCSLLLISIPPKVFTLFVSNINGLLFSILISEETNSLTSPPHNSKII